MNKVYKSILSAAAVAIVAGASMIPASVNAWGDSSNGRKSYTIADIDAGKLGDDITFNSISDSKIGDEKNFVAAKVSGANVETWNANEINVKDGETYTVRLYVHNNSPKDIENIAENVKATFSLPTTVAKEQPVIGYLDSSNAKPNRYWDEVVFKSENNIYLEYVEGSAKYTNAKGVFNLSDEVIVSGAMLGFETMDGKIPGCFEYDGVVTIDIKVHESVAAKLSKTVRMKGTKTWSESVNAKVGDEVEYQIEYVNLLTEQVNDVMIRDILPNNVKYVEGSTYLYNSEYQSGVLMGDNLTTSGINIGSYAANGNAYVRFTGKVVDTDLKCGNNQLVNWANSTVKGEVVAKDDASVMVSKNGGVCETVEATPEVIVNTGAGTVLAGAIGTGSVVTALGYFIASRKKM